MPIFGPLTYGRPFAKHKTEEVEYEADAEVDRTCSDSDARSLGGRSANDQVPVSGLGDGAASPSHRRARQWKERK